MIVTARQLEELHRGNGGNGQVILPYRARLSPLAQDYIRQRKLSVGYADVEPSKPNPFGIEAPVQQKPKGITGKFLWWCDGPCGPAKAALMGVARESHLEAMEIGIDARRITEAVKLLAREIRENRASGGVMLVQNAALPLVYANRCPSIRAVAGTCLEAVQQGVSAMAANVLVIETPYKTMSQVRSMLSLFVKAPRELSEQVQQQLKELATCG